jgi:hypothetical protein
MKLTIPTFALHPLARPATSALAGLSALASALVVAGLVGRRSTDPNDDDTAAPDGDPDERWRVASEGCTPDHGAYMDARLAIHHVDGSHLGYAVAMLRETLDDNPGIEPFDVDYPEALRSCIEVAYHLAFNIAEQEITESSHEPTGHALSVQVLHLVAGRAMAHFARGFEEGARAHALACTSCDKAGTDSPKHMRARFCRDLSDDLLLNYAADDAILRGVPIPAAMDAVKEMMETIEIRYDVSIEEQVASLTKATAYGVAAAEADTSGTSSD